MHILLYDFLCTYINLRIRVCKELPKGLIDGPARKEARFIFKEKTKDLISDEPDFFLYDT